MQVEQALYARAITLRNCGRFLHVSSDFGSNYQTHAFLSGEMLHAGLGRERTRRPRDFNAAMRGYDFFADYVVREWPVWFTPAMLVSKEGSPQFKSRRDADVHTFNSLKEGVPGIQSDDRFPKFGTMETILPGRLFRTLAISPDESLLNHFKVGQVFWMGKKRTMFQIVDDRLSETCRGSPAERTWQTPFMQVRTADTQMFSSFTVMTATQRYLIMRGETKPQHGWGFGAEGIPLFAVEGFLTAIQVG